ncbi:hypothetical protein WA026_007494 [Henosepilachna vigintioctopunctata]|uniref:Uncharacterized protein n=1 Tax=Henosepilachna vigintioctopunctata TaxID=420089 RepID=A0AAW1UM20_9CUCU
MNSMEMYVDNKCNKELSPVRWCDREVDGVYLGRSGWVQVHHRSLDERKVSNFRTITKTTQPQDSKRVAVKLADYHCKSDTGKFPSSPTKLLQPQKPLYLSIKEPEFEEIHKRSPQHRPESFSPPLHTPIISPPPAFQDKTSKSSPRRTFFGKSHFLPRSNAIDKDMSPPSSPPKETFKTCAPMGNLSLSTATPKLSPSSFEAQHKNVTKLIPQTKSLEETTATRRYKFLQKHVESSSSSSASSMGFRSLDSCVSRPTMPRLSENTDSSLDIYEDADDEDNNSSSINMSITGIDQKTSLDILRNKEKMLANIQSAKQAQCRNPLWRSPAGSDCNKPLNFSSSSTESIDTPARNTLQSSSQNRRSPSSRYISNKSPQEEIAQKVKRSRSLQLPERAPGSVSDRGIRRVSPQPPSRNVERNRNYNNTQMMKPQSFEGILNEDVRREAELVTEYIYGNRSRAAAHALLMHRLNNGVPNDEKVEPRRTTAEGLTFYYVGNQKNGKSRVMQKEKTPSPISTSTRISPKERQETSYGVNLCEYWPRCNSRDSSLNRDSQFVMRSSQSYPMQHHVSLDSANVRLERSIQEPPKRRSGVITDRRMIQSTYVPRNTPTPKDLFRELKSEFSKPDIKDRLSPSNRNHTLNENFQERKLSPSISRNISNRSLENVSNSSSSSDIWLASDRTVTKCPRNVKSSGASTPIEEMASPEKEHHDREMILTRPGSAPSQERQESFLESQQRSMSLPKSFLSAGYQQR